MKFPVGLLDHASPLVTKCMIGFVLASIFGICVAMCVVPPESYTIADYAGMAAISSGDTAWMLASSALVLIMTPGIAFFYGGMINAKNVVGTICTAIIPMALIPIMWCFIGFSLAFGDDWFYPGFIGTPETYGLMYRVGGNPGPLAASIPLSVFFIFQCMFAVITPAIIIGSIADRVNIAALCLFVPLWHLVVYCPIAHMVWHPAGIIKRYGVLDFAGGTVVHMSSGWASLVAAWYLGPSIHTRSPNAHPEGPANVPYVVLGTALLWFGWFGFNAGSALSAGWQAGSAFLNTNIATAAAMLAWMLMDQLKGNKFKATGLCLGAVVGLVGITPACGFVNVGAAALIGLTTAIVCSIAQLLMNKFAKKHVDDTLDVFACHGIGGTCGMIMTSLFQSSAAGAVDVNLAPLPGAFYGHGVELGKCLLVLVIIVPFFCLFTWFCLVFTNLFIAMRVSDLEEIEGLDRSKHGETVFEAHAEETKTVDYPVAEGREESPAWARNQVLPFNAEV